MKSAFSAGELSSAILKPTNWVSRICFGLTGLLILAAAVSAHIPAVSGILLGCLVAFLSVLSFAFLAGAMIPSGMGSRFATVTLILLKIPLLVLILMFLNSLGENAILSFAVAVLLVYSGAVANLGSFRMRRRHFFDRHG